MFDLKDKVALVTGAATGIGLAYVKELLRNELKGVALVDINVKNGQEALNDIIKIFGKDCAIFIKADVSDRKQFEEAFETTVKTFNQLDIVINNAGIIQEIQWEKCVGVNLIGVITGSMLAAEKYFPKFQSGSEGVILNTASLAGLQPYEITPTYVATKCGVIGFTRAMGGEVHYKTTNARIIAICPGATETTILRVGENQVQEPYLSLIKDLIKSMPSQSPEDLAKHAINLLKEAPTGSVWLVADGNCVQADFPKYYG